MKYCQENQGITIVWGGGGIPDPTSVGMVGWEEGWLSQVPCLRGVGQWVFQVPGPGGGVEYPRSHVQGMGRVPYHVTYPMIQVMSPTPHGQTHACENITFSKLPLRTVITFS